jgi:hypothetical protein
VGDRGRGLCRLLAALDAEQLADLPDGQVQQDRREARRARKPKSRPSPTRRLYPETSSYITRLFRLKHIDPDTVNGLLAICSGQTA